MGRRGVRRIDRTSYFTRTSGWSFFSMGMVESVVGGTAGAGERCRAWCGSEDTGHAQGSEQESEVVRQSFCP